MQELDRFAVSNQLQIMQEFSDAVSASNEVKGVKRENFKAACRLALKNDWDILVTMPSRFTRTLKVYDNFREKGGRLICANLGMEATEDKIRNTLEVEIVQLEQRQRTAAIGRQRAVDEGKLADHTVPEWGLVKSLKVRQMKARHGYEEFERQEAIARAGGAKTPRKLAAAFNKAAFKTSGNCRWKPNNVSRVLNTIAELKAAGALLSAAETVPVSNDNLEQIASSGMMAKLTLIPDMDDLDLEASTPSGYPLTSDELAEFRAFLERSSSSVPADKIEAFILSASNPTLPLAGRAKFMKWMEKRRAA
jgi:hypothetical protein